MVSAVTVADIFLPPVNSNVSDIRFTVVSEPASAPTVRLVARPVKPDPSPLKEPVKDLLPLS